MLVGYLRANLILKEKELTDGFGNLSNYLLYLSTVYNADLGSNQITYRLDM